MASVNRQQPLHNAIEKHISVNGLSKEEIDYYKNPNAGYYADYRRQMLNLLISNYKAYKYLTLNNILSRDHDIKDARLSEPLFVLIAHTANRVFVSNRFTNHKGVIGFGHLVDDLNGIKDGFNQFAKANMPDLLKNDHDIVLNPVSIDDRCSRIYIDRLQSAVYEANKTYSQTRQRFQKMWSTLGLLTGLAAGLGACCFIPAMASVLLTGLAMGGTIAGSALIGHLTGKAIGAIRFSCGATAGKLRYYIDNILKGYIEIGRVVNDIADIHSSHHVWTDEHQGQEQWAGSQYNLLFQRYQNLVRQTQSVNDYVYVRGQLNTIARALNYFYFDIIEQSKRQLGIENGNNQHVHSLAQLSQYINECLQAVELEVNQGSGCSIGEQHIWPQPNAPQPMFQSATTHYFAAPHENPNVKNM